ncbi:hypothetical protein EDD18DRAFT_1362357 [Armillaria luteobubalina]|uniref:Uncharacterized protein n=1 Tax=Armillaria luteobubalina TaxID=153913 RepID=A0AA39PEU8_9AGAR|nr:hypothetical protein EDD18DRAFT_1362357 [Armillaria luteobubalina]
MSIEVYFTYQTKASFERHFVNEAQDLFNALDEAIVKLERAGTFRKYHHVDCIVCGLMVDGSQRNMARFLSPSGRLVGTLYYSGNRRDAEYVVERGLDYTMKGLPRYYLGKLHDA